MLLKQLKLVTFDVTNTLLKFKVPPGQAYGEIARNYGFTGKDEDLLQRFLDKYNDMSIQHPNFGRQTNLSWKEWWREVVRYTFRGQLPDSTNVEIIANKLINEYKSEDQWTCVDGSIKLIKLLRERNLVIGIISNFDPRLHEILHNIKIKQHFDFVLTSYEVGYCKPDVRIFECAIKKCGIDIAPNMCLHIGDDMQKDYEGAIAAGWHGLLVNADEYEDGQNKYTVPSLIYLIKHLNYFL